MMGGMIPIIKAEAVALRYILVSRRGRGSDYDFAYQIEFNILEHQSTLYSNAYPNLDQLRQQAHVDPSFLS